MNSTSITILKLMLLNSNRKYLCVHCLQRSGKHRFKSKNTGNFSSGITIAYFFDDYNYQTDCFSAIVHNINWSFDILLLETYTMGIQRQCCNKQSNTNVESILQIDPRKENAAFGYSLCIHWIDTYFLVWSLWNLSWSYQLFWQICQKSGWTTWNKYAS